MVQKYPLAGWGETGDRKTILDMLEGCSSEKAGRLTEGCQCRGMDGSVCLWRAITEDLKGENCQDLVTNSCDGEGEGWLASGLRENFSYCITLCKAPAPRYASQNLEDYHNCYLFQCTTS